jgi:mono/diheme cytochrome c family protein
VTGAAPLRAVRVLAALGLLGPAACSSPPEIAPDRAVAAAPWPVDSVPIGTRARTLALAPPGPPVTPDLLDLGRRGYRGKCAPCHGRDLAGRGPVVVAGFPAPPPLVPGRIDAVETVAVVTDGRGEMPAQANEVSALERWAIARWLERR